MQEPAGEQVAPIRVLLADDHAVVRKGIRDFLEADPQIRVIAEADDGAAAWRLLAQHPPDVAVLDIRMPELNGVELTRRIKAHYPQVRVLILSAYEDEPYILALLRAGADGYILKTAQGDELVRAVKQVQVGKSVLDPTVAAKVVATLTDAQAVEPLSERELEVLRGVARGRTNRAIAQALGISDRTVQGHLANIFGKLHVSSRTEMVTVALQRGLITLDDTTL
ncbi:MAG TPA: response regulator transcription factor [Caldilineaceae bacterium]|nr:response regulator transcription factor [Caldilineaceae bacterium]